MYNMNTLNFFLSDIQVEGEANDLLYAHVLLNNFEAHTLYCYYYYFFFESQTEKVKGGSSICRIISYEKKSSRGHATLSLNAYIHLHNHQSL